MHSFACLRPLAAVLFLSTIAVPAFSQQEKGDSELGLSGSIILTSVTTYTLNSAKTEYIAGSALQVTTDANLSYGYYVTAHDLVGIESSTTVSSSPNINAANGTTSGESLTIDEYFQGHYRHLFGSTSHKFFPFVGALAGGDLSGMIPSAPSIPSTDFWVATGEVGFKNYVSQKTAFEVAYNLQVIGDGTASTDDTINNEILFGFTYDFGGPHKH
jgi:hypothetical protein